MTLKKPASAQTNRDSNSKRSNLQKNPDNWSSADEEMTDAQVTYLKNLCSEVGEEFDPSLSKAQASKRINALQKKARKNKSANRS